MLEELAAPVLVLAPVKGESGSIVDFTLKVINPAGVSLLAGHDLSMQEIEDQSLLRIFPDLARTEIFQHYVAALSAEGGYRFDAQFNRGDRIFWLRQSIVRRNDHLVISLADVSDLVEAVESMKQTNRALERFTGTIAHDLKAPVRRIVQFVEILHEEQAVPDEGHRRFFGVIRDNARHVSSLIDNLLAYAKARGPVHNAGPVDSRKALERALKVLEAEISERNAQVEVPAQMPRVMGNEILLSEVFQNLVSNAIRYNPEDRPLVRITASQGRRYAEFSVIDNGPGIPASEASKVFDFMVSLSRAGKGAGTGIGLAIAKEIVERHYGSIWIDPFYSEGACFSFLVPLAEPV